MKALQPNTMLKMAILLFDYSLYISVQIIFVYWIIAEMLFISLIVRIFKINQYSVFYNDNTTQCTVWSMKRILKVRNIEKNIQSNRTSVHQQLCDFSTSNCLPCYLKKKKWEKKTFLQMVNWGYSPCNLNIFIYTNIFFSTLKQKSLFHLQNDNVEETRKL